MTFAELIVGDHFGSWVVRLNPPFPNAINVNIKIACGEDGGGFATDLATRKDCIDPAVKILANHRCG